MTSDDRVGPRVIAVGAGKGGVGKSTVALHLALALRTHGPVGILDFDFYGPNIPAMLGMQHVKWTNEWILARRGRPVTFRPIEREGLFVVSMGFVLGEDQPLGMDPNTAAILAKQLTRDVEWPDLGYLVIDLPPGTSAVQHMLLRAVHPDVAIVVVTPHLLAHVDGRKAVQMFRTMKIPVAGGVENMSAVACPHCGREIALYEEIPADRSIWDLGVARLGSVPFDQRLARSVTDGTLEGVSSVMFASIAERVVASLPPRPAA